MKKTLLSVAFLAIAFSSSAQKYEFQSITDIQANPVISQDKTGTCWSFSTTSFLEAEIIKETGKAVDLSEMYNVRRTYDDKAWNYVMRQGHTQFGEGGLAHDVINSARKYGVVPQASFSGYVGSSTSYDQGKMEGQLEDVLKKYANAKKLSPEWRADANKILNEGIGAPVDKFTYEGKEYTPQSFLAMTKLNLDDYVTITSYTNEPYYKTFILDIPDNFSNGSFYNLPLDEYVENIDNAIASGYTLALDTDVSESTFSGKDGIAVIPDNESDNRASLQEIKLEKNITPAYRQQEFENFDTTDDHLMHIVGKAKDQKGNIYYKVKNSWGAKSGHEGYVYMSVPYLKLKSISVLVNKKGLLKKTKKELGL